MSDSQYCDCDGDSPEVSSVCFPVARKRHECDECSRAIQPGEKYRRDFYVLYGDATTVKTCGRCLDVLEFVRAAVPCFCYVHGELLGNALGCARDFVKEAPGLVFGTLRLIYTAAGRSRRRQWLTQAALELA